MADLHNFFLEVLHHEELSEVQELPILFEVTRYWETVHEIHCDTHCLGWAVFQINHLFLPPMGSQMFMWVDYHDKRMIPKTLFSASMACELSCLSSQWQCCQCQGTNYRLFQGRWGWAPAVTISGISHVASPTPAMLGTHLDWSTWPSVAYIATTYSPSSSLPPLFSSPPITWVIIFSSLKPPFPNFWLTSSTSAALLEYHSPGLCPNVQCSASCRS